MRLITAVLYHVGYRKDAIPMTKEQEESLAEFNKAIEKLCNDMGDATAVGVIFGVGIGKVLTMGGTVNDAHKIVDTTFEGMKAARANGQA